MLLRLETAEMGHVRIVVADRIEAVDRPEALEYAVVHPVDVGALVVSRPVHSDDRGVGVAAGIVRRAGMGEMMVDELHGAAEAPLVAQQRADRLPPRPPENGFQLVVGAPQERRGSSEPRHAGRHHPYALHVRDSAAFDLVPQVGGAEQVGGAA